ncbi:MAG: hypothetical protein JNL47_09460 [Bacteroidia bacterium]|nr:hypothetical protein [Bacteroidia bacterium]
MPDKFKLQPGPKHVSVHSDTSPAYTSAQAKQMNDFKVLHDTIFRIGFQQMGFGRYDGVTRNLYNMSNSPMQSNQ